MEIGIYRPSFVIQIVSLMPAALLRPDGRAAPAIVIMGISANQLAKMPLAKHQDMVIDIPNRGHAEVGELRFSQSGRRDNEYLIRSGMPVSIAVENHWPAR